MERSRPSPVRTAFGLFVLILGLTALNTRACAPYVAAQGAAVEGACSGPRGRGAAGIQVVFNERPAVTGRRPSTPRWRECSCPI